MIQVKLTNEQFNYLKSNFFESHQDLFVERGVDKRNGMIFLYVGTDQMELIRDWAGDELQRVGFDKNYGLTKDGKILEELIDLFYLKPENTSKNH